jgi:ABC-type bacteriocin/lantibiotic exporter with double-glycine peptidase domain
MEPIYDVLTAVEKMGQVTDIPLDREGAENRMTALTGAGFKVQLHDVELPNGTYVNRPVLSGINLELAAGSRVAVVGPPGSGKTALLHVLSGLIEPSQGTRILNGVPAKNWDQRLLRRQIGDYLAQEVIFDGTLTENLTVGRSGISMDDLQQAAKAVGLMPLIEQWPEGFETPLTSDGEGLPQTVVHQIFLARAIAGKPSLLVLDPFLRPFEQEERERLSAYLTRPEHPWTLVAATTEPAFLERCTHIVHLKDGRIDHISTPDHA